MDEVIVLPEVKRKVKRAPETPNALHDAVMAWYQEQDEETRAKIDVLRDWIILERHAANENCAFGE